MEIMLTILKNSPAPSVLGHKHPAYTRFQYEKKWYKAVGLGKKAGNPEKCDMGRLCTGISSEQGAGKAINEPLLDHLRFIMVFIPRKVSGNPAECTGRF